MIRHDDTTEQDACEHEYPYGCKRGAAEDTSAMMVVAGGFLLFFAVASIGYGVEVATGWDMCIPSLCAASIAWVAYSVATSKPK